MYDTRLKMSKARYDQVRDTIKAIVEHFGREQVCSLSILACPKIQDVNAALRWKLFDIAMQQLSYDDTHPAFVRGIWQRIVPHVPGFSVQSIYGEGLDDNSIDTALKRIQQELNVFVQRP